MPLQCITNLAAALQGAGLSGETIDRIVGELDALQSEIATLDPNAKATAYRKLFASQKFKAQQKVLSALNEAEIVTARTNSFLEVMLDKDLDVSWAGTDMIDGNLNTKVLGSATGYNNIKTSLEQRYASGFLQDLIDEGGVDANGKPVSVYADMFNNMFKEVDDAQSVRVLQELAAYQNSVLAKARGEEYHGPMPGHTGDKFAEVVAKHFGDLQFRNNAELAALGTAPKLIDNYYLPQKHFRDKMVPSGPLKAQAWAFGYTSKRTGRKYTRGEEAVAALKQDWKQDWIDLVKETQDEEAVIRNAKSVVYAKTAPTMRQTLTSISKIETLAPNTYAAATRAVEAPRETDTNLIDALFSKKLNRSLRTWDERLRAMVDEGTEQDRAIANELLADRDVLDELKKRTIVKDATINYDNLLSTMYDSIVQPFDSINPFAAMGKNRYERITVDRILVAKDAENWWKYQGTYGHGNIAHAMRSSMRAMAGNLAYARTFGNNARMAYAKIQDAVRKELMRRRDAATDILERGRYEKKLQNLSDFTHKMSTYIDYVEGVYDTPGNSVFNRFVTGALNVGKLRLGQAIFPALADTNNRLDVIRRFMPGSTVEEIIPFVSVGKTLAYMDLPGVSKFFNDKQARVHSVVGMSTGYATRLTQNGLPEVAATGGDIYYQARRVFRKGLDAYLGLTMTRQYDEGARMCVADGLGTYLGNTAVNGAKWSDLGSGMRDLMKMSRIGEAEWEIYRKRGVYKFNRERENWAMSARTIEQNITREDVAEYTGIPIDDLTDFEFMRVREQLVSRYDEMVTSFMNTAIITPNIETRARLQGSADVDSPWRGVQQLFAEFLSYPARVTFDLFRSLAYDFSKNGPGIIPAAARTAKIMALGLVYGYLGMTVKDMFNGRPPKDPLDPDTMMQSAMMGGTLGVAGETVLQALQMRSAHELDRWMGPTGTFLLDSYDFVKGVASGDMKAQKMVDTLYRQVPNLVWTKWAIDKFFAAEIYKFFGAQYNEEVRQMRTNETYGTLQDFFDRFTK